MGVVTVITISGSSCSATLRFACFGETGCCTVDRQRYLWYNVGVGNEAHEDNTWHIADV